MFDILVGHCDRHPDNIFVTDDGHMTLIDNDQIQGNIPGCMYESIFLPRSTVGYWGVTGVQGRERSSARLETAGLSPCLSAGRQP